MKNIRSILSFSAMAVLLFTSSCKKEVAGPAGPQGSSGPSLSGNLSGFIWLYDQYGTRLYTDLDSAKVSIDNSTRVSYTDLNGKYMFSGLNTGNYNITIGDTLYGSDKIQDLQFVGGGDVSRDVKLSEKPTFNMTSCIAVDTVVNTVNYVKVRGNIIADVRNRMMVVFANGVSTVDATPANYILTYSKQIPGNATNFSILIPATDLYGAGMVSTSTVYFAAYSAAINFNTTSTYQDFTTGRSIYNAIGATPINFNVMVP